MTDITKNFSMILMASVLGTGALVGCADGDYDPAADPEVGKVEEHLYAGGNKIWPTGNIAVCWESMPAGDAAERGWVKDQVARTWGKAAAILFTGWDQCHAGDAGVHITTADVRPHVNAFGKDLDRDSNGMVLNFTFATWSPSCASNANDHREFCIRAIAAHEFGHALGFYHEQLRPDTPQSCWHDNLGNDQPPDGESGGVLIGSWDEDSVMNYCNPHWNNDGVLSATDITGARRYYPGNMHQHVLNSDGKIGRYVDLSTWNNGWTNTEFFQVGGNNYFFQLKTDDGTEKVFPVRADGTFGPNVEATDWNSGWTSTQFFTTSQGTFLFTLKESDGVAKVLKVNANGTIGALVEAYNWTSGWSSAKTVDINGTTFLVLVKRSSGEIHVNRMNANGKVGTQEYTGNVGAGFTTVEPYQVGGSTYVFFLKSGDGTMRVRRLTATGDLGATVDSNDWLSNWTSASFYRAGGLLYLIVVKEIDGTAKILRVGGDGKIDDVPGHEVFVGDWTAGWSQVETYEVGGQPYLFLLKDG